MLFFLDSADTEEIRDLASTGLIDGVTTNPTLIAKSGRPIAKVIEDICNIVGGPVSAEVTASDVEGMLKEGRFLASIADNVTVKVPLTMDGLKACHVLTSEDILVNVTLCFSPAQALLAAKAGATFVSPFAGRLDDIGEDGIGLIQDIVGIYQQYPDLSTQVLAASLRNPAHVVAAARVGADVATLPPSVFRQLYNHHLTDKGIAVFMSDWKKTGLSIL